MKKSLSLSTVHFSQSLLILFVQTMASAAAAKLVKLKPVGRVLFVFRRHVVAFLALRTL